jgi:hypothetical protein
MRCLRVTVRRSCGNEELIRERLGLHKSRISIHCWMGSQSSI